eukprot:TRINITY_DN3966_c0_g1_i4.p1 TRINITY_DN3966_c0_g1~~TRINITY_DN3966_c0_g1_i4.p1  ORF type:complete len:410 (+),score=123.32 TRINITY_DN3966_c0_g1_i4:227-1456(+)
MGKKEGKKREEDKNSKKKQEKDPLLVFAEKVRDHKDLESRWAVMQEVRVEYFRGKDFAALIRKHPELTTKILPAGTLGQHESAEEVLGELLLQRKLIVRCERLVKTIRAGKKKLSKWPGRLEFHKDQVFSEEDGFYAWTFERTRPIWQMILSFMVPIVTVACCLFPVFPHSCKLAVLYLCLTFLALIFGILFLRWAVFGIIWIAVGKRVWFFPNILAEEATLLELIRVMPLDAKDEQPPPKLTTRLSVAAFTGFCIWFCVQHAPDQQTRARYRRKVTNIIDDVLTWTPGMLAGNTTSSTANTTSPPFNSSSSSSNSSQGNQSEPLMGSNPAETEFPADDPAPDLSADLPTSEDETEDGTTTGSRSSSDGEGEVEGSSEASGTGEDKAQEEHRDTEGAQQQQQSSRPDEL